MYFVELIMYLVLSIIQVAASIIKLFGNILGFSIKTTASLFGGTIKISNKGLSTFQKIDRILIKFDPILYKLLGVQPKEKLATVKIKDEKPKVIPKNYH